MMSKWQPMNTAPADREILIYRKDINKVVMASFCDLDPQEWHRGVYVDEHEYFFDAKYANAWMELPEPPDEEL